MANVLITNPAPNRSRYHFSDFGSDSGYDAAHLVNEAGNVLVIFAEPEPRRDYFNLNVTDREEWNEPGFRETVRAYAVEIANLELGGDGFYLVWNPERDDTSEEHSHHCVECGKVIATSEECDGESPHDFARCGIHAED